MKANFFARGLKALTQMVHSAPAIGRLTLPRTNYDYGRAVGTGTGSSTIMAPVLWIARTFPEAPPKVEKLDGERIPNHPMVKLLRRPNPHFSGAVLWIASLISWTLDGNVYWLKVRNNAGNVIQLWWVPHWTMQPVAPPDGSQYIEAYNYDPNGLFTTSPTTANSITHTRVETGDVVHFRFGLDGMDPRKGLSPLKSVLREVFTDDEAANFSASLLRNMGIPGVMISPDHDEPVPDEDAQAYKEYVENQFTGDYRGRAMALQGRTKVQQFGFTPQEMTLRELRRIPEERTSGVIGIPAMVAGLGAGLERSTFSNYAEARRAAYEQNISPTQLVFSEEMHHQLLPDFERTPDNFKVGFDTSKVQVLQEDENQRAQRHATLVNASIETVADARLAFDLPTEDTHDVFLQSANIIRVPSQAPPEEANIVPQTAASAGALAPVGKGSANSTKQNEFENSPQASLIQRFEKEQEELAQEMADDLEKDFEDLGQRAAQAFRQFQTDLSTNGKKDNEGDAESVLSMMAVSEWIKDRLKATFEKHYRKVSERVIEAINTEMQLGVGLPAEREAEIVSEGSRRAELVGVRADLRAAILRSIVAGREDGEGPVAIARRIREAVPAGRFQHAGARYRALMIARTETKFAQNQSTIETYRANDQVRGVMVFDNRIGFNDPECTARNGRIVTQEEAQQMALEEHPNGTLSFAPATAEQSEALT